jgi:GNAT superfamily N-acetyltransferase
MQGSFLPMVRVEKGPFVGYQRPEGVAYISNLAVAPSARRQGVGEKLLAAAEEVTFPLTFHASKCLEGMQAPSDMPVIYDPVQL